MNNKGQAVLSEYVMTIFIVIAAAMAVMTYLRRGLEARINEARNYSVRSVVDSGACDTNCMAATGGNIAVEYEPYYANMLSEVSRNATEDSGATQGNAEVLGVIYLNKTNEATQTSSSSTQLPPQCAAGGC